MEQTNYSISNENIDKFGIKVNSDDSTISLPDSIHQFYLNIIAFIFVENY